MVSGIERRGEPRVRIALRVQISGTDAQHEEFSEKVLAMNLTRQGARLWGVQADLQPGHVLRLSYGKCSAEFRIIWVLEEKRRVGSQVGLRLLQNQDCPWEEALPAQQAAEQLC
jgi:hypothetical protein